MTATKWNQRYSSKEYIYGTEPNAFFKTVLKTLPSGKILLPAEGEGRNALFAAQNSWNVTAFDISEAARIKAITLCNKYDVKIDYQISDYINFSAPENSFDAIALIFAHVPALNKKEYYQHLLSFLKPNGVVIFEAFSKKHQKNQEQNVHAGGPKDENMLFSKEELLEIFSGCKMLQIEEKDVQLTEGIGHFGNASVVRCVCSLI